MHRETATKCWVTNKQIDGVYQSLIKSRKNICTDLKEVGTNLAYT